MPVAPPPAPPPPQPLAVIQNNIPDLKEPEPEQPIEYNAAAEYKKALIASSIVFTIILLGLILVFMQKDAYDSPICPDDDWYKLNDLDSPRNCEPCGQGTIVMPLGGELEKAGSLPLRAILYFLGLGWCFLGIAIVCDQFMAAIEEITSKQKVVWVKVHGDTKHKFHKKIWNDTVANLTLMALGSSAPEILLSVIELVGNNFFSGKLGASTIVGSAAFNFFVITAVCIAALPDDEVRYIEQTQVYYVTLSFSLFAYVWILVVIQLVSPDVVTIGEAMVTLVFFPILTLIAYFTDIGKMCP